MAHDVDDKRALFVRVLDDIVDQIRTGRLKGGDVLPTARKMAETYGVASMTAQRALRELQQRGLTYAVVGKGTFVHPLAASRLDTDGDGHPTRPDTMWLIPDNPALNRRVAEFLLRQNQIASRFVDALLAKDGAAADAAAEELAALKTEYRDLTGELAKYEAEAGIGPVATAPSATSSRPRRQRKTSK
jgi:DNA-binding FadR family transcriptional regulator